MQRVAPINTLIARCSRRTYAAAAAAAAESTRSGAATSGAVAPGMMKAVKAAAAAESAVAGGPPGGKAEIFWMRDPKTGNWIPENRFGEVDAAELRELLLSKK